jgi:hypothetical protein
MLGCASGIGAALAGGVAVMVTPVLISPATGPESDGPCKMAPAKAAPVIATPAPMTANGLMLLALTIGTPYLR